MPGGVVSLGSVDACQLPLAVVIDASSLTGEQRQVADRALRGENLFITGAAGTGKSYLLRYIIQEMQIHHPGSVGVTAPTGLAAVNIGGMTLHSFAGIGAAMMFAGGKGGGREINCPERFLLNRVRKSEAANERWQNTRVLVIDEVSMLEPVLFEQLDFIARQIRQQNGKGFGGMQVLLCGDFLQLPPVEASRDGTQWSFCFETPAWRRCGLERGTVILKQAVRQSGDPAFVQLLNEVRAGRCSPAVAEACHRCHVTRKPPPTDGIIPTRLYCTNRDVDQENDVRLAALRGDLKTFQSQDNFHAGAGTTRCTPAEKKRLLDMLNKQVPGELRLKVSAQVILIRKLQKSGLVNGSRGVVTMLHDNAATVRFDGASEVRIERESFSQASAQAGASRRQLPLRLGWALTVHKSQGMTLTCAEVQVDDAFSCGQAYVALSRLTGFQGLWIGGRGLSQRSIRAHPSALAFYGIA